MQNRFGFKDFVLLVTVLIVGLLVVLNMFQADRGWEKLALVESKLGEVERMIGDSDSGDIDGLRDELAALKTAIASRPINVHITGVAIDGTAAAQPSESTDVPPKIDALGRVSPRRIVGTARRQNRVAGAVDV